MDPHETYEVNGNTVKIYPDRDGESPREWENLGHMVCWHRRMKLGDEQIKPGEFGATIEEAGEYLTRERKALVVLPVYIYEHGGITITSRAEVYATYPDKQWDAGQVGFIYVDGDAIRECFGVDEVTEEVKQRAAESLAGEVDTYDMYLTGDVWAYVIEDEYGEVLDSCGDNYGLEYAKKEAESHV